MRTADASPSRFDLAGLLRSPSVVLAAFTATIFLSALLLFTVQPMFARMVLPRLGGAPSVWAVSMCFFQAVLLGGYCYAHLLNRQLGARNAVLTHVALLALATFALPIALPASATAPPSSGETLWLIGVLLAGVGLPFFAVSANAPLLQSWFGRVGHAQSADPYFLYGASNIGSLLALLSYPVLMEPLLGLAQQGALWSAGFVTLGAAIAVCGVLMLGRLGTADAPAASTASAVTDASAAPARGIGWRTRGLWIVLAMVPSALLVAFTTYVSTDIASAPFLWVIPLAIFLGTFTAVFRDRPWIPHLELVDRQPVLAALAIFGTPAVGQLAFGMGYVTALLAFVVTCLVCHRELYARRPDARYLTEFYLWMSFGGVLGGMFSALLAPVLFSTVIEFPLLLVLSTLLRPQIIDGTASREEWRRAGLVLAGGLAALLALRGLIVSGAIAPMPRLFLLIVAAPVAIVIAWRRFARAEVAAVAVMLLTILLIPADGKSTHVVRSFFGVHRVVEGAGGDFRLLMHGTTVHGARRLVAEDGAKVVRPVPATYYHPNGPMHRSTDLVRGAGNAGTALRYGVVGLGSGAIACASKPGESWRFFEIDQAVVDIARDSRHFDFLSTCQPNNDIVVGDARLTLEHEPAASFDYLLIDAFSSDSIPTHLLTVDSLKLYLGKLKPGGVLAFHVTNRHLDLAPVVAANAATVGGLDAVVVRDVPAGDTFDAVPSTVMLMSRHPQTIAPALAWQGAAKAGAGSVKAWTDDYSDIMSALVRSLGH